MSTDYFSEQEAYIASQSLPSPSDTPYHTPVPSGSRRSSRYGTPSSGPPSSPPPLPPDNQRTSEDAVDENISILDPRRFTPTLHASLVSEILSLRRELDSKHKFIEDLETSFETSRNEIESLTDKLTQSGKESRSTKRHLQQLENGTLEALEALAKERDEVREANADLKKKLEASQKKLRTQDDDSARVHDMWSRDKETWDGEKRLLERRVHISESRLKIILEELAAQDAAQEDHGTDSEGEDNTRDSGVGHESDTASIRSSPRRRSSSRTGRHSRNLSNSSHRSLGRAYRFSLMSGIGSEGHARLNGMSLADELIFDEEEEDLGDLELDSDDFPENEMRARRALESRQSMYPDEKAKRILGLTMENKEGGMEGKEAEVSKPVEPVARIAETATVREVTLVTMPPKRQYVDTGIQFSPPPSPTSPESISPRKTIESPVPLSDIEANQRRKRVSAASPVSNSSQSINGEKAANSVTSTSSQTLEQPLSPPATPKIPIPALLQSPTAPEFTVDYASISTQTDISDEPPRIPVPPRSPSRPMPITVPSIAIHPPLSAPTSPKEPILPPGTKNAWSQTTGQLNVPTRSISIQTEEIRVDRRPVKLPPHLLPSAISSKPGTPEPDRTRPEPTIDRPDTEAPVPAPSVSANRHGKAPALRHTQDLNTLLSKASEPAIEDRYPGNNDNGPLARDKEDGLRRPFRTSSLFAGFDGASSDEENDAENSDDDYRIPQYSMMSSRAVKHGRLFNNPPTPVPEDKEVISSSRISEDSTGTGRMYSSGRNSLEKSSKIAKPLRASGITRQPSIRRSAMIQNGTVAHYQRSRSPSIGSIGSSTSVPKPPFPVPTRSSSRRIPLSKSEGSQSPTPRSGGMFAGRRPPQGAKHQRKDSLRKIRSAAVIPRNGRQRSRSPPLPATPVLPQSPQIPPLPNDMITGQRFGHQHQLSTNTSNTGNGSVASSAQQTSVVDAIAATMVGEWMWKYVRKRKTFGGPDSPQDLGRAGDDGSVMPGNGIRHKRWVWLSPYERSVMWSSKQPTSGTALLGKSGRKLTIQSVLDVPDNTPLPKGAGLNSPVFNRSILILTPARALKFTVVSRERHYLWLTALSFLAHSSSGVPELGPIPPVPPPVEDLPQQRNQGASLRRAHIRDSVRLAKDKAMPQNQRQYGARADPIHEWFGESQFDRPVADAADPPNVPRVGFHGRKRSSTGPRAPPPNAAFRNFSHNPVPSTYSTGSSDLYGPPPSVPSSVYNPNSVMGSSRTSEASSSARHNFFDAVGTVRMEAFVEPILSEGAAYGMPTGPKPRPGRRRGNSQWSGSTDPHRTGGLYEDSQDTYDPFRNF
ncbi:uncharacterized protein BDZ99DRAFT_535454 [Mytilinidion resinicola]|uniref:Pleckstrin homology domain-containing protein n=1 Tax=Mytilinidion resinicola TaxID=574789 RepID=A0A6A6YG65_9PEZI|nr:uncharacterized protein BDZ99DRAFT_535454 [Mytilinidion resinicola]KAF2807792.1 hypothetical protein BDZ99DRAFT_535454 [Mytilinidion resinicola]